MDNTHISRGQVFATLLLARVVFNGEMMKQNAPCVAIPSKSAHKFYAVNDSQCRPLIFSIGTEGHFYLAHPDHATGKKETIELNKCFGLAPGVGVTALAVTQNHADDTIYVVFATRSSDAKQGSTLYVISPKTPLEWENVTQDTSIASWAYKGQTDPHQNITQVTLAQAEDKSGYPPLAIGYEDLNTTTFDITRIAISVETHSWAYAQDLRLPVNAVDILDICCSVMHGSPGLFVLYKMRSGVELMLIRHEDAGGNLELQVPNGATTLASVINMDGHSELLISGSEGLHHFQLEDIIEQRPDPAWNPICADKRVQSSQQLHVAQRPSQISVWVEEPGSNVTYQQFHYEAKMKPLTDPTPLLDKAHGGGAFAAVLHKETGMQKLFVVGENDQLTHLTQDPITRDWQHLAALVASPAQMIEFSSFTSHIHISDQDGTPHSFKPVCISSTSTVEVAINGQPHTLGPNGVNVETDAMGNLTVIHRVNDKITPAVLTIKDVEGKPALLGQTMHLNPADKVMDKISRIKDAQSLCQVKLSNGNPLVDRDPDDPIVKNVAEALVKLHEAHGQLPADGGLKSAAPKPDGLVATTAAGAVSVGSLQVASSSGAGGLAIGPDVSHQIVPFDLWHWVTNGIKEAAEWMVHKVEDAVHWIIKIGEQAFHFVLDCVTHVYQALSWVLNTIVDKIEKLIDWLGFIFNWEDIVNVHSDIVDFFNQFTEHAPSLLPNPQAINTWFDHAKQNLHLMVNDDKTMAHPVDSSTINSLGPVPNKLDESIHTPGANWANYHYEHGGIKGAMSTLGGLDPDDPFHAVWNKAWQNALQLVTKDLQKFSDDVSKFFTNPKACSLVDMLKVAGVDLLITLLDALRAVVLAVVEAMQQLSASLRGILNKRLDLPIPMLSTFYKSISGKELTILDLFALLLAIPVTVLQKLSKGDQPPAPPAAALKINMALSAGIVQAPSLALKKAAALRSSTAATTTATATGPLPTSTHPTTTTATATPDFISTIYKRIKPHIPTISLCGNIFLMLIAPVEWLGPGTFSWVSLLGTVFAWLISYPFSIPPTLPGYEPRRDMFVMGLGIVLAKLIPIKLSRAALTLVICLAQCFPLYQLVVADDALADKDPHLDRKAYNVMKVNRISSQIAKIFSTLCTMTNADNVPLVVLAVLSSGVKISSETIAVGLGADETVGLYGF